jgi:wobble nucleotide-excising tRNase
MDQYKKYNGVIEKITLTDATFKNSMHQVFEPSWINYFYGNNGTGKSTIARALKAASGLTWRNGKSETDFVIRIFSRDFVTDELKFNDDDPTMPGVLTLGEEFIDAQSQIEKTQNKLDKLREQNQKDTLALSTLKAQKDGLKTRFTEVCWEKGKEYKKIFGGSGDFSKMELFANRVRKTTPVQHILADLKKRFETATDASARKYNQFATLDLSELATIETFPLLGEAIISTADSQFSRFMRSLEAAAWVKQGHEHYALKAGEKCPYCQQQLGSDFESQIAECFDGKYSEDCAKVVAYHKRYTDYTLAFTASIKQYIDILKAMPQGFGNISENEKTLILIEKTVADNNQHIASKIANPSDTVSLDSILLHIEAINSLFSETNDLIVKNNAIIDNKKREVEACMTQVWELLAFELRIIVNQYSADDKAIDNKITAQTTLVGEQEAPLNSLKTDIKKLTEKLGGSGATIQKVNDLLKATGFRGFSLVAHKTVPDRYVVVRDDGTPARKLSEGERNFIAFLYFYYLVQGSWTREELIKGKIVAIDDPVSSLDSGVLSIVGSLVRELIDDCFCDGGKYRINQIFILTHNPYFHSAVSQQMLKPEEAYFKKVSFYEIKKGYDNISTISKPCCQKSSSKDPDIEYENFTPVQNSYSALWQEYKDAKLPTTLLHIINRIADYHFFQLCSYNREDLKSRITAYTGNNASKLQLINELLIHVYENDSTEDSVGSMIYYPATNTTNDYKDAFRTVFEAMGQGAHYSKMSGEG